MMMETVLSRSLRVMFASGAALMLAQPAFAQDNAPIQRVEITGSAIKRIDAETAVPVTVVKMADLKKEGITTIEQVMANLSVAQSSQGTSQSVGSSTGGAAFADLRGIGQNKTLVLLNGRRLGNNAFDSSAPDLNMIPFAALERVEVLRDGASSLYGSDAVGGVINFITKKDYQGGTVTLGADSPEHAGGFANNFNVGYGWGDLDKQGFNIFAVVDHQEQHSITGTQRDFNRRYPTGLSGSTSPANWTQGDIGGNPSAPDCTQGNYMVQDTATSCAMSTSPYVDYIPSSKRTTGLVRGTFKINENHELGVELLSTESKIRTTIAPVPYGYLYVNSTRADGSANPYFPSSAAINPTYDDSLTDSGVAGLKPGYVVASWRDLYHGARHDENINKQQRLVVSMKGTLGGWDYDGAVTYNQNKVRENLFGYSNGSIIADGVMNGIINPFGAQDAAGNAMLESATLGGGNIMNAKGTNKGADIKFSREVGDWFSNGHQAGLAVGAQYEHQDFRMAANSDFAAKVVSSTGIDPNTLNEGSRNVSAFYSELNVPVLKNLDLTAAVRYDKYSDFGHTANPKFSFNYRPTGDLLLRGSFSKGFRAPSLYDLYAGNAYTNGASRLNDPTKQCSGTDADQNSCGKQFQVLNGGNANLSPERSKNATVGIMWEPIKNLSVGADFWSIRLTNQIGTMTDSDVLANYQQFASYIVRNAAGNLAVDGSQCPNPATCGYLDLRTQNLGDVNTNGVDLSANYRLRTKDYGSFTFSDNATWVHKYEYQNYAGDEMHQRVGVYSGDGPIFRWQNTLNVAWSKGKFGAGLTGHYKSGYQDYSGDGAEVLNHRVSSYTTWDTYGSYEAMQGLTLTAGLRNLFDREPPLSYQTSNFQGGYDPRYTDPTGRTVYVRATYNF